MIAGFVRHSTVKTNWFQHEISDSDHFINIPNTPDIVMLNSVENSACIIDVGCCFDLYMDTCYYSKVLKYQPLLECILQLGYECTLVVLVSGSLVQVHRNVVRGLQLGGMQKRGAKKLAKFCSVSAIIGSMHIWRRRCFVYP